MTLSRPPEELGQALGFLLGLYFGDEGLEAAAVLDVVVEHVVLVGLAVGVVEDDGHVRLDGDAGVVAVGQGVAQNVPDAALSFAGEVIVGVVFLVHPGAILDVDVRGVFPDVLPVLPRVLLGPRLRLGAVGVEDGVGGVEHPLEAGDFLEQLDAVLPAHAAVVHAVFVNRLQSLVEEARGDFAESLEDELGRFIRVVGRLEAHDANVLGAESLHARDGAVDLGDGHVPWCVDRLGPVANG